jgi:glycosyltransferase involved in cell wall biosynthesis
VFLRRLPPNDVWGGLEKLMVDWFERIDYQNCRVTLGVTPGGKNLFGPHITAKGLPVEILEFPWDFRGRSFRNFRAMHDFLKPLKATTIIYIQGAYADFRLAAVLAGFMMTRGNVFMHENLGAPLPPMRLYKRYFGFLPALELWRHLKIGAISLRVYFSKAIVVVSREMKDRYIYYWNYLGKKVTVGYHGVDVNRFSPSPETFAAMRDKMGIASTDTVFITTARLAAQKCLHRVIDAFDGLCGNYPNLRLIIAGDGSLETELKALAESKPSKSRITFLGHVVRPDDYLKMSNIFVLASDNEGLSISFLEAMATGLICVSTRCTGATEVLQNRVTGFLVEKNTESIQEGMRIVMDLPRETRERIARTARQFIVDNFEINKNVRNVLSSFGVPTVSPAPEKPESSKEPLPVLEK